MVSPVMTVLVFDNSELYLYKWGIVGGTELSGVLKRKEDISKKAVVQHCIDRG